MAKRKQSLSSTAGQASDAADERIPLDETALVSEPVTAAIEAGGADVDVPAISTAAEPQPCPAVLAAAPVSPVEPAAVVFEAAIAEEAEVFEELCEEGVHLAEAAACALSSDLGNLAREAADYAKNTVESRRAFISALLGAKSWDSAVRLQASYAVSAYARLQAYFMATSRLYAQLCASALAPVKK